MQFRADIICVLEFCALWIKRVYISGRQQSQKLGCVKDQTKHMVNLLNPKSNKKKSKRKLKTTDMCGVCAIMYL